MGVCSSCEATSVATAKLILYDGRLQEFPHPVKVSYVLQKNPSCFICSSDEMDFDGVVSAVGEEEELQPGQLYFALPLSRLQRRLQADDMAALAVKASSALTKSGDKCGHRRNVLLFSEENGGGVRSRKVSGMGDIGSRRRNVGGGRAAGRRSGKFSAQLSAIPE
ncbi:uncharacterized protein LOC142539629 [Primulina tabacum]|uniref:uncharacterized protein LOC142538870 n=1 Tax=Primulina tabacum TaxID=48773 RepID=UPI003F5A8751